MTGIPLGKLTQFLDTELALSDVPRDESANGLQVEGKNRVRSVGLAVDACEAVFSQARQKKIDFLFVHHGLIWGGVKTLRGLLGQRIRLLHDAGISLYACHLPLDRHPVHGNNAQILKLLSLRTKGEFGDYHGQRISFWGRASRPVTLGEFCRKVERTFRTKTISFSAGKKVQNVGVISGGGWFGINEAEALGCDTFLTGEPAHSAYHLAREMKVNLVFAGHYATETPGVLAVGKLLERRFGLRAEFLDQPTGL